MCVSTPRMETPASPPTLQTVNSEQDMTASKVADVRRRRQALSRSDTRGAGAMQGSGTQGSQAGKVKLGQ